MYSQERDDTSNPFVDNKFNARFSSLLTLLSTSTTIIQPRHRHHQPNHRSNTIRKEKIITVIISRLCCLAVCFKNGDVKLLTSYDDVSPQVPLSYHRNIIAIIVSVVIIVIITISYDDVLPQVPRSSSISVTSSSSSTSS